ncbi:hypothetical protein CSUI_005565, partial [Cystoisospora suis]
MQGCMYRQASYSCCLRRRIPLSRTSNSTTA